jgi:hypothetical protein
MNMPRTPKHRLEAMRTNEISLLARVSALKLLIESPGDADQKLLDACKAQSKLAGASIDDLGIKSMSLNTLKATCNRVLQNGFEGFDLLRKQSIEKYQAYQLKLNHNHKNNSKAHYQDKIHDLENIQQNLINSHVFMAEKYSQLLNLYRRHLQKVKDGNINIDNELRLLDQHLRRFGEPGSPALTVVKSE